MERNNLPEIVSLAVTVESKMDIIQNIFLRIQDIFFESPDWKRHVEELESADIDFRSIAYESASMSIALEDLKQGNQLANWGQFLNEAASAHATQVHVGLGWALAQELKNPMLYVSELNPMMRYRVFDGYGYYEGIFRRRRSISNRLKLEIPDTVASGALDQGIGRSIWYLNKGIFNDAKNMIEGFAVERHKDLWRGLGIAISYVGGCDEEILRQIFEKSGQYKTQLSAGAVMGLVSRAKAGFISEDSKITCRIWCKQNAEEIVVKYGWLGVRCDYADWIRKIEKSFSSSA